LFTGLSTARAQIEVLEKLVAQLVHDNAQLKSELATLRAERVNATAFRADLDAITARMEQLATAHRSEMGKLWHRLRGERTPGESDDIQSGSDFEAFLELQNAAGTRN
jgi:hypothetical protein